MNRWWVVVFPVLILASFVVFLAVSAAFGSSATGPRNIPSLSPDTQKATAAYTGPASRETYSNVPSSGLQMLATQTSNDGFGWTTRTLTSLLVPRDSGSPRFWDESLRSPSEAVANIGGAEMRSVSPGPDDRVKVILELRQPSVGEVKARYFDGAVEVEVTVRAIADHRAQVVKAQSDVLAQVVREAVDFDVAYRYSQVFNGIAGSVRMADLPSLAGLDHVRKVHYDYEVNITLSESVPIIGAPDVWAMQDAQSRPTTGHGIVVAIVDTGIDYTHSDLGGCLGPGCRVIGGYDFVNDDPDPMDDMGHGTHVAGIVGASGVSIGVAPDVTFLGYKVLDETGGGFFSDVIAGIEAAVDPDGDPKTDDGADVINMSLGGTGHPDDAVSKAVDAAVEMGVTVVVSAGNSGPGYQTIGSPGVARKALTVGATKKDDDIASFSSRGPVSPDWAVKPDVVAPGVDILAPVPAEGVLGDESRYRRLSGTSMSAPHVAGAVALVRQLHPAWTPDQVKAALMNSALDLGLDTYTQGSGRIRPSGAAGVPGALMPPSLSLGLDDLTKDLWQTARTLTITNGPGSQATYHLSVEEGLPEGAMAAVDTPSVTLDPGESRQVQFTLSVDNTTTPNARDEPFSYDGAVVAQTEGLALRVPFSFIKSPVINFTFDEEPWILWLHDENGEGYFKAYPGEFLTLPIGGTGDFNAVITFGDVATRVFVEDIQVETVTNVTVTKADAVHNVSIEPVDQNGDRKFPNIGGEALTHKASGVRIGFIFGFPTQRRFSDISDAYSWEWAVTESIVSKDPVYDFNGYIHHGLTGDRTFRNEPAELKHMLFQYDAPIGVGSVMVQHWLSDGPRGGTSFTVFNTLGQNALAAPFARDVYFMPIPSDDFAFGYFYEDVIPFDASSGPTLGRATARTAYLAARDPTRVHGYLAGEPDIPVLRTDASRMDLGLPPPHWFGRFENSDTEIRLKAARGWPLWLFLNPLMDFVPHPDLPYELYRDGILVATGDMEGAGEFTSSQSISIPAMAGGYSMVVANDLYRVGGQSGTATVTASFDTRKTDRDPPTLLSLAVLSSDGERTRYLAPTARGRVALSFDEVLASVPVVKYGTGDNGGQPAWRTAQVTDLGSGDYVALLPSLPNQAHISLRLTALDAAGNGLEYEIVPAFKVALEAPVLSSPADGYNTRGPEVSLRWRDVDTAVEYTVQVDGENTFDSPNLYEATLADIGRTVPVQNGIYYWRARTRDSALNESIWSAVRSFTVADPVVQITDGQASDNTPAVVQDSGGRISVVWSSCPTGCNVRYKSSDDGGSTWSAGKMVSSDHFNDYRPDITSLEDGTLWAVWHSNRNTGPGGDFWNNDIFYSTSSDGGLTWSPADHLTTHTSNDEAPAIARTSGARLLVVWHSNRSGSRDLWYKTSDDAGDTWSEATQLTANASDDLDPDVAALDNGDIWVVWNKNGRIHFVTGDDGGVSWSGERQLAACCRFRPSINETAGGKLWAAWHSATDTNGARVWNDELFYTTTDDGGASWSFETKYTRFLGTDRNVGVAAVGSGDSLGLVWESARKGDTDIWFGIVGRFEDMNAPPAVLTVSHLPFPNPDSDDEVTFTTQVAAETSVAEVGLVWSVDGVPTGDLVMLDDGNNGDSLARDGIYGVRIGVLEAGTTVEYRVRVADEGGNVVVSPRAARSFRTLEPMHLTTDVLLVVDTRFAPSETAYYTTALEDLGFPFDLWETHLRGPVDDMSLSSYLGGAVVWAMPDYGYLPQARARDSLASYLDGGGSLFISGQNLGEFLSFAQFHEEYLYADHVQSNTGIFTLTGVAADPVGSGFTLGIQGFGGANNQYSPGEIAPIAPAVTVLTYDDPATQGRAAAVRVDTGTYRLVHFAFGFGAINTREDRAGVMGRVIGWLIQGSASGRVDLQNRDDDSGATVSVVGTGIAAQTDSEGRYLIQGIPPGKFDIEVTMPTFLTARKTGVLADQGMVTELRPVLLRGGDLNRDGRVDGLDLAGVGVNLGRSASDW